MAYSIKGKMKLLRELHNPEYAEVDLHFLQNMCPQNDLFRSPIVNAARHSEKILYTLLEYTTSEKIRLNRRRVENEKLTILESYENEGNTKTDKEARAESSINIQCEGRASDNAEKENLEGDSSKTDVTDVEKKNELTVTQ